MKGKNHIQMEGDAFNFCVLNRILLHLWNYLVSKYEGYILVENALLKSGPRQFDMNVINACSFPY